MRMSVPGLPIIMALCLLQLPGAFSAALDINYVTLPPSGAQGKGRGGKALHKQVVMLQQQQPPTTQPSSPSLAPTAIKSRTLPVPLSQPQQSQLSKPISSNSSGSGFVSASSSPEITPPAFILPPSSPTISTTLAPSKKTKDSDLVKAAKKALKAQQIYAGSQGLQYFYTGPIRKYNLIFPPGALETLRAKPFTEQWAPCSIEVDFGTSYVSRYDGCGCRYKGSVGSLRMCIDRVTGQPNGSCRKLSWKVDATRFLESGASGEKPTQRIKGVKELSFGGLPVDLSLLTERLSSGLLQSSGIISFRANYALLNINGKSDGVYSLLELPGDLFTHDRWGWDANGGDGALYKEALVGRTDENETYFKEHRVSGGNEDDFMMEVNNAVINATTDAAKQLVLDTYFDVKSFIDVTAFNTVIGNTDDWRQRHNFLWYVLATEPPDVVQRKQNVADKKKPKKVKKLILIPSDYDRINDGNTQRAGLGKAPKHWYDPISPDLCTQVDQTPEQRASRQPKAEYDYWVSLFSQYPPDVGKPINCDQFAKVFSLLAKQVNQRVVDLATGTMSGPNVDAMMAAYAAQISKLPGLDPDPPNMPEWEEGKQSLKDHIDSARSDALTDARSELARMGASPTPSSVAVSQSMARITTVSAPVSPSTTMTATVNVTATQNSAPWPDPLAPQPQSQPQQQVSHSSQQQLQQQVSRSSQQPQQTQQGSMQVSPSFASYQPSEAQSQGVGIISALSVSASRPFKTAFSPSLAFSSDSLSMNSMFPPLPPGSAFPPSSSGSLSEANNLAVSYQPKPTSSSSLSSISNSASSSTKPASFSSSSIDIASRSLALSTSTVSSPSSPTRSSASGSAILTSSFQPSFPSLFSASQGSSNIFFSPPAATNWAPATSSFGFQPKSG